MNTYSQDDFNSLEEAIKHSNGIITPRTYFVQVPNSFIRNPNLTTNEKMMYLYLWGFGGETMNMYPSQARMEKELKLSRPTIIKILKSLEEKGGLYIIQRIKKDTKEKATNLYYLCAIDNNSGDFQKGYLDIIKAYCPNKIKYI